jgi:CheY-like chemotaxis protein/HPt (histidine-containing phosphotransfer) domain-containing protein
MYGGQIRVESEVGRGSTFFVTLFCETVEPESNQPPKAPETHAKLPLSDCDGPPAKILIVEDNPVNQKVVTAILRKKRYRAIITNDGREAIECLEREPSSDPFRLVLMDVQMPVLDGLEATRAIRSHPRWNGLPIVAMTAHAMNGDRERCLQAGMNGYISKPVNPAHLLATVEQYLMPGSVARKRPDLPANERFAPSSINDADPDLVESMLRLFLQMAPERMQRLEAAIERADEEMLLAEAEKIEAAARSIAPASVGASARLIAAAARQGDFEAAGPELMRLGDAIGAIPQYFTEPAPSSPR